MRPSKLNILRTESVKLKLLPGLYHWKAIILKKYIEAGYIPAKPDEQESCSVYLKQFCSQNMTTENQGSKYERGVEVSDVKT